METITTVDLGSLSVGATFICPWKPDGKNAGKVRRQGVGSVGVHVPNQDCDGWEDTHWAPGTQVVPCDPQLYAKQGFGDAGGRTIENRSEIESPVKVVHRICSELAAQGKGRKEMIEACIEKGVNPNTAKTQYYHWKRAFLG